MMTKMTRLLAAAAATLCLSATANAAVTYDIQNGKLMAIRGLNGDPSQSERVYSDKPYTYVRAGVTYQHLVDIEFTDGTCSEIFGECNEITSFRASARRVPAFLENTLKDGIVVDGTTYNFSSMPPLVNGCSDKDKCTIFAGFRNEGSSDVVGISYIIDAAGPDTWESPDGNESTDTAKLSNITFARFKIYDAEVTNAVPEPATWALMLAGFGLTGAALRRRRAAVAQVPA